MDLDSLTQAAQAGPAPETWVGFAKYVFDKVWMLVIPLVYAAGLATKRPRFLRKRGTAE